MRSKTAAIDPVRPGDARDERVVLAREACPALGPAGVLLAVRAAVARVRAQPPAQGGDLGVVRAPRAGRPSAGPCGWVRVPVADGGRAARRRGRDAPRAPAP